MIAPANPGMRLADRYELLEEIGSGGMGRVFRAHDGVLDRVVAVKLLDESDGPTVANEARTAAGLSHANVASIYDVGTHDGCPYIVMEFVPGRTLAALLRDTPRLSIDLSLDLAAQVADALEAAHRRGIVHCDVKPQNIMITPSGQAKLVDFGIARAAMATRTRPKDEIKGSAPYLAPEQVRGEQVDARTDIYALGTVLYEMLAGHHLFEGPTIAAIVTQRLVVDPPSLRASHPAISDELDAVVLRAVAREPSARFQKAADLRDSLLALSERGRTVTEQSAEAERTQQVATIVLPARKDRPWRAMGGWVVAALGLMAFIAVGVLAFGADGGRSGSPSIEVPDLMGTPLRDVPDRLEQARLKAGPIGTSPVEAVRVGRVVAQEPNAGTLTSVDSEVALTFGTAQ